MYFPQMLKFIYMFIIVFIILIEVIIYVSGWQDLNFLYPNAIDMSICTNIIDYVVTYYVEVILWNIL